MNSSSLLAKLDQVVQQHSRLRAAPFSQKAGQSSTAAAGPPTAAIPSHHLQQQLPAGRRGPSGDDWRNEATGSGSTALPRPHSIGSQTVRVHAFLGSRTTLQKRT